MRPCPLKNISQLIIMLLLLNILSGIIAKTIHADPDSGDPVGNSIPVTDIEISNNFKDIIKVGETIQITARVLPEEASDQMVVFSSADTRVATISEDGIITGVAAGTAAIIAQAGEYKKSLLLTVKVGTQNMTVNTTYLVLSVGATYQLTVTISPREADQNVTWRSAARDIVSVTSDGRVKALKQGNGSILVSNWDTSRIISIIVDNKGGNAPDSPDLSEDFQQVLAQEDFDTADPEETGVTDKTKINRLIEQITLMPNTGELTINGTDCETVNSAILKELYGARKTLHIRYPDYSISLYGRDIKNIDNVLDTRITLSRKEQGLEVPVSGGNLPGRIYIELYGQESYSYLYLYDDERNTYNAINTLQGKNRFSVDSSGTYLLTRHRMSDMIINWTAIIVVGIMALGLILAWIAVKKRYWFW